MVQWQGEAEKGVKMKWIILAILILVFGMPVWAFFTSEGDDNK